MQSLTASQVEKAKVEKRRYLMSLVVMVVASVANGLLTAFQVQNEVARGAAALVAWVGLVAGMITTWRLCRAIGVGLSVTLLATTLAPFFFIIELVILLRVYARRTGLGLTFFLGDKSPGTSTA